jgi:hypothetical protein
MTPDEVVPSVRRAIWIGLDAYFLEDVPDCLLADLLDTELAKLANDPRVAEAGGLGNLDDQFPDLLRLALATLGIRGLGFAVLLRADPPVERRRGDDPNQLLIGPSDRLAVLEQPLPFLRGWIEFSAENGVAWYNSSICDAVGFLALE